MKRGLLVGLGVVAVGLAGWALYRAAVPPVLTIYSYNANDGTGTFQWGRASGTISLSGFSSGNWMGNFTNYTPGTGWTFQISKSGVVKKAVTFNSSGIY